MVDRLSRAITSRTRAVGVTWAHSSTGVKIPIAPIADAVARANRRRAPADRCLLIVDGVHGFGNQDVDVAKTGLRLLRDRHAQVAVRAAAPAFGGAAPTRGRI